MRILITVLVIVAFLLALLGWWLSLPANVCNDPSFNEEVQETRYTPVDAAWYIENMLCDAGLPPADALNPTND